MVRETSTTANIDAKHALGTHVGPSAMEMAIEKAQQHGVGVVTVYNTGHLAGCSHYVYQAIEAGMIGHTYDGRRRGYHDTNMGFASIFGDESDRLWRAGAEDAALHVGCCYDSGGGEQDLVASSDRCDGPTGLDN